MKNIFILILSLFLVIGCEDTTTDTDETNGTFTFPTLEKSYNLVDTGQEACYDSDGNVITAPVAGEAFYGQDAQFDGNLYSFATDDNIVADYNTGLMWQKVPSSASYNWQEAVDYCEDLELGSYDDWRIPSNKELYSISNFATGWPYLDTDVFDLASGEVTKDEQFWSSNYYYVGTTHNGAPSAFGVNHVTGHIKAYPAEAGGLMGNYVRAVRGDEYGINELTDNGDGTITDAATELMWAQSDFGLAIDWGTALTLADTISWAGYSDWRLPDVKELQGLVDYSGAFPAIDPMFSSIPIVNEAGTDDFGYYWTSTSALFQEGNPYYYAWYVAFGRAVDTEGEDTHGAGAVRFDTKVEGGPLGEGGERYYNYIRLVREVN